MLVPFNTISPQARLWVYQANRILSTAEVEHVRQVLTQNLTHWQAHQMPLSAAIDVAENRFVLIAVDESVESPSGCSIDKSVHWLQELGVALRVDFFDRSLLFFDEKKQLHSIAISAIKTSIHEGLIGTQTQVVNTLVKTKAEWQTQGITTAENTWLRRYFKVTV